MLMAAAELGVLFPGEEGARGAPPTPIPDGFTLWTGTTTIITTTSTSWRALEPLLDILVLTSHETLKVRRSQMSGQTDSGDLAGQDQSWV